jgi:hypothetical protein
MGWQGKPLSTPMERRPMERPRSAWVEQDGTSILGVGTRVWQRNVHDGHLTAMVAKEPAGWHLSISHRTNTAPPRPGRYPTWDEIADARYQLLPDQITVAMLLPPSSEYVNAHQTTFHLHEITDAGVS